MDTQDNHDICNDGTTEQLILVQQNLRTLPIPTVQRYSAHVKQLDLSHNTLKTLDWLGEFSQLRELVLDGNRLHEAQLRTVTQSLPQLQILMLNKNEFSDLRVTVKLIKRLFPNLQYLSLHGNPICPDGLGLQPFSSYVKYDYEYYSNFVAQSLPKLKFLDHSVVQRKYRYESFPHKMYRPSEKRILETTNF